jgi:hypothetical protein
MFFVPEQEAYIIFMTDETTNDDNLPEKNIGSFFTNKEDLRRIVMKNLEYAQEIPQPAVNSAVLTQRDITKRNKYTNKANFCNELSDACFTVGPIGLISTTAFLVGLGFYNNQDDIFIPAIANVISDVVVLATTAFTCMKYEHIYRARANGIKL